MKIVVGLSGGVDSSVAAALLKEQGHEIVGVTMQLCDKDNPHPGKGCFCASQLGEIEMAKKVAAKLGIPHYVIDCHKEYADTIMKYFHDEYLAGKTPNPCVRCNAEFKFGLLPKLIEKEIGPYDKFATGHYARIVNSNGNIRLAIAVCKEKDQSYFLSQLTTKQLEKVIFPLGEIESKEKVRNLARKYGFETADKKDSMDFYSGNKAELVEDESFEIVRSECIGGSVVDVHGNKIGMHGGYWKYTVGQRHGFSCKSTVPMYILKILPERNELVVGPVEEACKGHFKIKNINWLIDYSDEANTGKCNIKIRSNGKFNRGYVVNYDIDMMLDDNIIMDEPVFGVTPGQLAVAYDDNGHVICSGYIC